MIAVGAGDGLDLGEDDVVCVVEFQKARLGPVDDIGICIGRHIAKPQPEIARGFRH